MLHYLAVFAVLALVPSVLSHGRQGGWGLSAASVPPVLGGGGDVLVAVIDDGLDSRHPALRGRVEAGSGEVAGFARRHGTHVAGIILGVYPRARLLDAPYYVEHSDGASNMRRSLKALRHALDSGAKVINYSGGGSQPNDAELELLREAWHRGVLVVAAAGNDGQDLSRSSYYPASYGLPNMVVVAAMGPDGRIASSSNYGPNVVDLAAPGVNVLSSVPDGTSNMSGSSQATAFVSGAAAAIIGRSPMGPEAVRSILLRSAKKTKDLKPVRGGALDVSAALAMARKGDMQTLLLIRGTPMEAR